MATNGGKINFEVGFVTNSHDLSGLKKQLNEIRSMANDVKIKEIMSPKDIQTMVKSVNILENAMNSAFDVDLNTVNIKKFNQLLKQSGTNLNQIHQGMLLAGDVGKASFARAAAGLMQFNSAAKQTNQFLDKIATSFANTVRWTLMSTIVNNISSTIQKSYYYVKDLDSALNDIRIVTGKSADEMDRFATQANNAAKELAVTTKEYTEGALIYYQQGLNDNTVKELTDITAKTSNVTGQSMSAVSEQLTAVWNGYKVANQAAKEGMQVYEEYVDKMAAVGASTASDLQELSTAMSKVASAASAMGVGFDDLNAQIATIVSVTRQAPESVGTALKTIYARLGDLKVDGVDEFGTKLGEISAQLQVMGINVVDSSGQMRDMSDVIAEVAQKWDTWTEAQRQAAAVAMAGKRQYNNLIALFDNWDMYGEALETSMNAAGTLEEQQEIALDSLKNKMDQLQATAEDLYDSLYDEEDIKNAIEGFTNIIQVLADFSDSIDGLKNLLPMLGSLMIRVFNKQITDSILTIKNNLQNMAAQVKVASENYAELHNMFADSSVFKNQINLNPANEGMSDTVHKIYDFYDKMYQYQKVMSEEDQKKYRALQEQYVKIAEIDEKYQKLIGDTNELNSVFTFINQSLVGNKEEIEKFRQEIEKISKLSSNLQIIEEAYEGNPFGEEQQWDEDVDNILLIEGLIEKAGKQSGYTEEQIKGLSQAFEDLADQGMAPAEAWEYFTTNLQDLVEAGEELDTVSVYLDNVTESTEELSEAFEGELQEKFNTGRFLNIAGAIGQIATSINTIKNIGAIFADDDLSAGDKFVQIAMNLGFVLPSLISGIKLLNAELGIEFGMFSALSAQMAAYNAVKASGLVLDTADVKVNKLISKEKVEQAIVLRALMAGEIEENGVKVTNIDLSNKQLVASYAKQYANEQEAAALELVDVAQKKVNASMLANPYVLVAAAILAVVAATATLIEKKKKENEQLIENNKQKLEEIKADQELIDTNKQLLKSYNDLYKEYQTNEKVKDDLYEKTLELADAYDIEDAKILALGDHYDILTEKIKKKREEELKTNIAKTQEGAKYATQSAAAEMDNTAVLNAVAKGSRVVMGHHDFYSGLSGSNKYERDQVISALTESGMIASNFNFGPLHSIGSTNMSYSIDFSSSQKTLDGIQNLRDAISKLEAVLGDKAASNGIYKQLVADLQLLLPYEEEIKNQLKEEYSLRTELVVSQSNLNKLVEKGSVSSQEYRKEIQQIKNDLVAQGIPLEEVYKYIEENVKGLEQVEKEVEKMNLAEKIHEAKKQDINEIYAILDDLNDGQLAYIVAHLNTDYMTKELNEWIKAHNDDIEFEGKISTKSTLSGVIKSGYKSGEGFTDEAISALFQDQQILNALKNLTGNQNLTEDIFKRIDATEQLTIVTKTYLDAAKEAYEATEGYTPEFDWEGKTYKEGIKWVNQYSQSVETLHETIANSPYKDEADAVEKAVAAYADAGGELDKLEPKQKEYITYLLEHGHVNKEILKQWGEIIPKYYEGKNALETYKSELERVADGEHNFKEELASIKYNIEKVNEAIDDCQKQFKSLVDIMSDYNETGHFTLDNAQAIVDLDTQYAASLEFVGDKLQINEEYYQNLILSKIQALRTTVRETYENQLLELSTMTAAEAQAKLAEMTAISNAELDRTPEKAAAAAKSYEKLAEDIKNSYDLDLDPTKKKIADFYEKEFINKNKALDDVESEARKGDYNFRRVMGAQTQEDKDKDKAAKKDRSSKDYKYARDEIDRYWEINKALDEISRTLKKLDKIKSHVFGKQKIQALEAESKLIQKQTEQYKRLYEEQKKEAEELKGQLTEGGVSFSAAGEVLNYGQAMKNALDTYNKGVDDFNNKVIDEEGFKKIESNYEQFKKNMERYDKLFYTDMKDTLEKIEEEAQKLRDIELEKFEIKLQLKIDKAQLRKDFRNFRKELEKDFTLYYEVLPKTKDFKKNFKDDKAQVKAYMKAAKEVQHEIDIIMAGGTSTMFASLTEAQEKLKEINKSFEEASRNTMQDVEDAWSNYIAMIDQANEKLEEQEKRYERVNAQLESFRQIMELAYGPKAYEEFDRIYQQQIETNQARFESAQKEATTYQKLFEKQLAIEGASADNMDTWSEATKKYYDQWKDSEQKIYDLTAERIQLLKDQYTNIIDQISNSLEMDLTGGIGYDISNQEWELAEQRADLFYNETEKAYQLQTLNNKIQKDMNKSSLATQKKLQQFRDEKLKELDKEETLTKFQLEAAEAEYDILLKQIALEEAKNNKTSMKLTRNTEGNWSYQYVSDTDDVMDKQQELLDSWEKLRSLAQQTTEESSKALMDAMQSYSELMAQNEKDLASGLINEQQYEYQRKMLKEQYENPETGILTLLGKNYQEAKEKLIIGEIGVRQEVYDQDKSHYITFTDEEKAIMDDFMRHTKGDFFAIETAVKDNYNNIHTETENRLGAKGSTYVLWNTAARQMADKWSGSEKDSVKNRVNEAFTKMSNATVKYKEDVTKAMKQAGLDAKGFEEKLKGLSTETNKAKDAIDTYCDDINKKLPKAAKKVQEMIDAWNKVKDSINAASLEIEEYLKKQQDMQMPTAPDNLGISGGGSGGYNRGGSGGSGGSGGGGTYTMPTIYYKDTGQTSNVDGSSLVYLYTDSAGTSLFTNGYVSLSAAKEKYKNYKFEEVNVSSRSSTPAVPGASKYDQNGYKLGAGYWYYNGKIVKLASGGYTGTWSNPDAKEDGRLAFLHQKELVLNANDTENFLAATDTLRNLVSLDSSIEKSIANAISKMLVEMSHNTASNINTVPSNSENTNNIFNINAEFPNANDVNEIREAILSLPNLASQYIHRTGY